MINYFIELALIHMLLFAAYWLILRNENQYGILRFFLLASSVAAITIPFFHLPDLWTIKNPEVFRQAASLPAIILQPVEINHTTQASELDIVTILFTMYLFISGWFLFQFTKSIYQIIRLRNSGTKHFINEIPVIIANNIQGSFNFMNWIFINENLLNKSEDHLAILNHEESHRKLGHTYDLLFLQLFRVTFWWLPTSWLMTREIKKIHEYQADVNVIFTFDASQYIKILISSTLKSNGISLASSFHEGFTMKRINAMKKQISKINPWKLSLISFISAIILIGFACNEQLDASIKELGQNSSAITFDQLPVKLQSSINQSPMKESKDQFSYVRVQVSEEQIKSIENHTLDVSSLEQLQNIDPSLIQMMDVDQSKNEMYFVLSKESANFNHVAETSKSDDQVFTIVEDIPQYPGGMEALYKLLMEEIKYPKEALEQGIEGRVYVQFVVEKDGSVSEVIPVKGIGAGCDEEAVRVLKLADKFEPGMQRGKAVKVRMVLPIIFQLKSDKNEPAVIFEKIDNQTKSLKVSAYPQDGTWYGTVWNNEENVPMSGVSIVEESTTNGTVTDQNGNFHLKPVDDTHNLVFSHVGFKSYHLSLEQ